MADRYSGVYAILLAGGSGTRLWPVSRALYPKQLVKFIGNDSLVQNTIHRLTPVLDPEKIRIVCGQEHVHEIARHLSEIGLGSSGKIISEPCGRNTAPAILLAVLYTIRQDPDAVICVFPADHVIRNISTFHERLAQAVHLACNGHIVTFGIRPHYPETGYGYIEGGTEISGGARMIERFVEKPDRKTAEAYVQSEDFFWNSGMFVFRASVMADEFKVYHPILFEQMQVICRETDSPPLTAYEKLPNVSIDYAIMEKTRRGVLLPSDFEWSDIGSWKSLYDFLPKDEDRNVLDGDVITQDTRGSFILGDKRLIATNHLRDVVIIETPDSVFVSDIEHSRDVKSIVDRLKKRGRRETVSHKTLHHAWGTITELLQAKDHRVDQLTIYAGKNYTIDARDVVSSHLVIAQGTATVDRSGIVKRIENGESLTVDVQEVIVLENREVHPLVVIYTRIEGGVSEAKI